MEIPSWLTDYAPWAASIISGGGGGLLGKKMADKEQDKKIEVIEGRLDNLEKDIHSNNVNDENLNQRFEEHKNEMKDNFSKLEAKIDEGQKWLLSEILKNMRQ